MVSRWRFDGKQWAIVGEQASSQPVYAQIGFPAHYILRVFLLSFLFGIRKNCESSGRNVIIHVKKKGDKLTVVIMEYRCFQPRTKLFPIFCFSLLTPYTD
jgi:hypothetical protein